MKRVLTLPELIWKLHHQKLNTWLDKLTFPRIFLVWIGVIIFFGFFYYFFSNNITQLFYPLYNQPVTKIFDSIYFSFITATSTGFGDIIPLGMFKIVAIVEVVFGLVLLAFVTSKLISIKQNVILSEVYEISFHEKINRVRSSLLLFRQNLGRIADKIEEKSIRQREVSEMYNFFSSFEDTLNEINFLLSKEKNHFTKVIDTLDAELIFRSVVHSFEKAGELLYSLEQSKIEWRREIALKFLDHCLKANEILFEKLKEGKILPENTTKDLTTQNINAINKIKTITGTEIFLPPEEENESD